MSLEMIGVIPRDATNELRVYHGEYWKKEVIDLRWYTERDGEMYPTKKGIRMNVDEARHVLNLLIDTVGDNNVEL